jgi:DNA-binding beta-propeller fold protein YncE
VPPLLKYAPSGKLLDALGAGMFVWPHALYTDREGNIWLSDAVASDGRDPSAPGRGHQVFKLSPDGKVLLTLGKAGQAGSGSDTFFAPSDVVVASNGDIFVADGHGGGTNARIVKFNRDGKYLKEWGTYGSGPGDFTVPHAIAMDSTGRIFVGDRNNNRIQIFDQDGKFLDEWKQFGRPSGMYIDKNDTLYVTDTQPIFGRPGFQNGIYIGSTRDGKVSGFIPKINELSNMEGIGGTADGSVLFGAEIGLNRIVKFVRR